MRNASVRCGLAMLLAGLLLVPPAEAKECKQRAIDALHAAAPDGWSVYGRVSDKKFFMGWLDCDDPQFELSTAVHESVHSITAEKDAFPMIDGGEVALPHEVSKFYPPSAIAGKFGDSDYVLTYLKPGRASSSSNFLFLLDELDAYSHDLNTAVDLKDMRSATRSTDHRDGLAALMAFTATYVEHARQSEPETWEGLRQPRVSAAIEKVWGQAEKVMASSCGIPDFGTQYVGFLQRVCKPEAQSALASVIGRQPICPTACLKTNDEQASADTSAQAEALAPTDDDPPVVEKRTIWKRRHHPRPAPSLEARADDPAPPAFLMPRSGR